MFRRKPHLHGNHDFHFHPCLQWTILDPIYACDSGLRDKDVTFIHRLLDALGAAVGRIGEQKATFIRKYLHSRTLRSPKVSLLRRAAVSTRVMRRRRGPLRRGTGSFG